MGGKCRVLDKVALMFYVHIFQKSAAEFPKSLDAQLHF